MIRALVAIAVVANSVDAARVATKGQKSESKTPFVASCEDLQSRFRSRVTAVQALLNTHQDEESVGTFARARLNMRVFGVVRTLRRARNCQWVLDGDSEDIEQARSVVQQVLAENPCAEAAMAEMTQEAFESAPNELQPLQRAMIVLMSETCEVPEQEGAGEAEEVEDDDAMEERLVEAEEETQDHIDELFEQAALESESMAGGSFVQTDAKTRFSHAIRVVGAIFFGMMFAMLCIPLGVMIGAIIGLFFCALDPLICGAAAGVEAGIVGFAAGYFVGGAVGFGLCAYELIQELMPSGIYDPSRGRRGAPTYGQPVPAPVYYVPAPVPAAIGK